MSRRNIYNFNCYLSTVLSIRPRTSYFYSECWMKTQKCFVENLERGLWSSLIRIILFCTLTQRHATWKYDFYLLEQYNLTLTPEIHPPWKQENVNSSSSVQHTARWFLIFLFSRSNTLMLCLSVMEMLPSFENITKFSSKLVNPVSLRKFMLLLFTPSLYLAL